MSDVAIAPPVLRRGLRVKGLHHLRGRVAEEKKRIDAIRIAAQRFARYRDVTPEKVAYCAEVLSRLETVARELEEVLEHDVPERPPGPDLKAYKRPPLPF